jgi:hypothetical protein
MIKELSSLCCCYGCEHGFNPSTIWKERQALFDISLAYISNSRTGQLKLYKEPTSKNRWMNKWVNKQIQTKSKVMFTYILLYFACFLHHSKQPHFYCTVHCTLQVHRNGCQDSCQSCAASLPRISAGSHRLFPAGLPLSGGPIPVSTMAAKSSSLYKEWHTVRSSFACGPIMPGTVHQQLFPGQHCCHLS